MEKNKRNKIIGLSLGILVVLIIVVSSTYAYWQITRTQTTPNDIVAACLSLDLNDADAENTGINLDSAWPISDDEGKNLAGYSFTVTNNCDEEINYIVGLNRVEEESANYLLDSSIKLQLDDNSSSTYGDLSDVEYVDAENTEYTARSSKQVSVETIGAKGINTHTIRIWVSDEAPVTEQSKTFLGQVFITGGQGINASIVEEGTIDESCFTVADNGIILDYDETCGLAVSVPAVVDGIPVKEINMASFVAGDLVQIGVVNNETEETNDNFFYYKDTTNKAVLDEMLKANYCEDTSNCDLSDYNVTIFNSLEEYNAFDWSNYTIYASVTMAYDETNGMLVNYSNVTSLDLSEAVYLETIATGAFHFEATQDTAVNDTCVLIEDVSGDYYDCKGVLKSLILPQNGALSLIDYSAFANNQLTEVTIPASVVTIGAVAFVNNNITSLVFEDTDDVSSKLTTIDESAFSHNDITGKLVIPSLVETIGTGAFEDNPNLTEIIIKRTETDAASMTLGTNWNLVSGDSSTGTYATVTYDPDYTE